jgi:VWFA-related protein
MERRITGALLLGWLAWGTAAAQAPAFRANSDLVTVPCAVLDERGAPVKGLEAGDFQVFDNGRRRVMDRVWVDGDSPLTLGVIIDASASQESKVEEHRQTALQVLERILRPGDRAFVRSIPGDAGWDETAQGLDEVRRRLAGGFGAPLRAPCAGGSGGGRACGSTPLWDAVFDAARLKLQAIKGNKALLLITDGYDIGSVHTWREAADATHKAETAVYAIQYRSELGGTFPKNLYSLLAEAGGTWFTEPKGNLDAVVSRLRADLRERYVLSFRPDKLSPGIRHEVEVKVTRPELTVRGRKIYFWPPE